MDVRLQILNPAQEDPEVGGIEVSLLLLRHAMPLTCIAPVQDTFSLLECLFAPFFKVWKNGPFWLLVLIVCPLKSVWSCPEL